MNFEDSAPLHDLSALRIRRDARPARRAGKRLWVLLPLLVLGAGGGLLYVYREQVFGLAPEVEIGAVVRTGGSEAAAVLKATGYVVARLQAGVTPKVTGRIAALHKDLGDRVRKGEVLAEIENRDVQAFLEEARATLWVAQLTAERERKLAEAQVGAQDAADLALARAREAAARVKNLEEQLENTLVRAPFDGTIIVKNGEVGETVSLFGGQTARKSGPIFVVADFSEFEVEADVNESNIAKVESGQAAEVTLDAFPKRPYAGRVRQIVPTADRQKATIQAKVTILDPDGKVFPEMSASVYFLESAGTAGQPARILAPAAAVVERGGRRVAFVLDGEQVRLVEVEAGAPEKGPEKGKVEVKGGLQGGEKVVLSPPPGLSDGDRVRVREAGPVPTRSPAPTKGPAAVKRS